METIILRNATIIDGTGADPVSNGSVIVEGDRIKEVLSRPPGRVPSCAIILDCRQKTLLPGLIDAHVHMGAIDANLMEQHRKYFSSTFVIRALQRMKESLDQGFTTARDCGGIDAGFREAVAQGLVPGPRLFVAGRALSQTGGRGDFRLPNERYLPVEFPAGIAGIYDGVDEVRRGAREQLRQGVDHIKVMAGGGCSSPNDVLDSSQYSVEELRAIVFEAESAGKYVCAHLYSNRSIHNCIAAGVRSLEHGNLLNQESARAIKDAGAFLVLTLATYEMAHRMKKELMAQGVPEFAMKKFYEAGEKGLEALEIAHRVGVKIASGSDGVGPKHSYQAVELELKARVLGPMGAIVASTKTNAELLRREQDLGTIEAGKLADLILVDGDPLKDITVLQQYRERITLIMQGGRLYKNLLGP